MRLLALLCLCLAVFGQLALAQNKTGKVGEFTCIRTPLLFGPDEQTVHVECAALISKGRAALARWGWQDNLGNTTRLLSTKLEVAPIPGFFGEGEERVSLKATFQRDDLPVPTCQTKRRLSLTFANEEDPAIVKIEAGKGVITDPDMYGPANGWHHYEPRQNYEAYPYTASEEFDEWQEDGAELLAWESAAKECPHKEPPGNPDGSPGGYDGGYGAYPAGAKGDARKETGVAVSALPAQTPNRKLATPGGLNVLVKCKSAPAGAPANGTCSVRLRLRLTFSGGLNVVDTFRLREEAQQALQTANNFQCAVQTFQDLANVLSTTQLNGNTATSVNPNACHPPAPAGGSGRKLLQARPAQSGSPTIPAGAVWDNTAIARAVRAARYESALHGCLPGVVIQGIQPRTARTWDDVQGWGSSGDRCRSCAAMEGINYGAGLGGPPVGWETPDTSIFRPSTFRDAAMVFTDTALDSGNPAIVVVFRATVTALQSTQWVSNVGFCLLAGWGVPIFGSGPIRPPVPVAPGSPTAGNVCFGWRDPISALNNGNNGNLNNGTQNGPARGLFAEVQRRIIALRPNPDSPDTPTRIFVFGHSRGGALAATFAGFLLAQQQLGQLGNYVGPLGRRAQISLYTHGAPAVGDTQFARNLEQGLYERFRIINRYDPVVSAPLQSQGYFHWRPSIWYNQPDGEDRFLDFRRYCVLTSNQALGPGRSECFTSCDNALVCAYNVVVPAAGAIAGDPVPASPACQVISDSTETADNGAGVRRSSLGVAGGVRDHATYMGVSLDNIDTPYDCRSTYSVWSEGCIKCSQSDQQAAQCPPPSSFTPFTPPPLT